MQNISISGGKFSNSNSTKGCCYTNPFDIKQTKKAHEGNRVKHKKYKNDNKYYTHATTRQYYDYTTLILPLRNPIIKRWTKPIKNLHFHLQSWGKRSRLMKD